MKEMTSIDRREAVKKMALIMGITATAPMITTLLNSCSATPELNWQPRSLSISQANFLTSLSDFILPETTSLGAVSLGVPQFIDGIITEIMTDDSRLLFLQNLDTLLVVCKTEVGQSFEDCNASEKANFLTFIEGENKSGRPGVWGTSMIKNPTVNFFWKIKGMIVTGYYLTEEVGERILSYDPVPGQYQGCIPVEQVGKVWSL